MKLPRTPRTLVLMSASTYAQQFDSVRLARLAELVELVHPGHVERLSDCPRLADVDVLITSWGAPRITAADLAGMPRLRGLFHCAGTVRDLVCDEFWRRGIVVTNAADANSIPVAEYTFACVVMAGKKAPFLARARAVSHAEANPFGNLSNLGLTVGVLGYSRIGRRVVQHLRHLHDATVLVADPYADPAEIEAAGATLVTLDEMLPRVDVLSLHAPSLPETRHIIGARELRRLSDHSTVINTARGALIDTHALERECVSGRLNAILDVTDPEPLPATSPLYALPNVMVTPHVAGSLGSEILRMTDSALDDLESLINGIAPRTALDAAALQVSA